MEKYKNKDWLYQKYVKEELSACKIGKLNNCSTKTIWRWLKKYKIKTRSVSEAMHLRLSRNKSLYKDKKWLCQKYIEEKLSTVEIAKIYGYWQATISGWLKKFNIPTRSISEAGKLRWQKKCPIEYTGKNSSGWRGGRTITSTGYISLHRFKHPFASKRGYIFEHRLIMEREIGRYLYPWETVHHVNGIKTDNRIENLKLLPSGEHNVRVQEVYKENQWLKTQLANFLSIKT